MQSVAESARLASTVDEGSPTRKARKARVLAAQA